MPQEDIDNLLTRLIHSGSLALDGDEEDINLLSKSILRFAPFYENIPIHCIY